MPDIAIDGLRGQVVTPDHPDFETARRGLFYGGFDRRPAAVVRVTDARDVARTVTFARERDLRVAVRSGGHSIAGHSIPDDAVVIDLSPMRALEIDPETRTAWAETGLTAAGFTSAADEHGLALGFGDTGSVGIGGITLGGGIGFLVRRFGMTIDDLLAAEIVTADGDLVTVDEDHEPDLFWAIRGGGGNFGVATRFRFRLHPLEGVVGGMMIQPATPEAIRAFVDACDAAPDELSVIAAVMPAPPMPFLPEEHHGRIVLFSFVCFADDAEAGERAIAPLRAVAEPLADMVRPIRYPEMYTPDEEEYHPLGPVETMFVDEVDDASAEAIVAAMETPSSAMMRVAQLRVLGGAYARVPNEATAFAHRDRKLMVNVAALVADPAQTDEHRAWVRDLANAIQRGPEAAYVNFLGDEGPERIRKAYPHGTWERLLEIKRRYDPENVFRMNQNIWDA